MRFESDSTFAGRRRRRRSRLFFSLFLLGGLAALGLAAFRVGPAPGIALASPPALVGRRAPLAIRVAEPRRGLARVTVEIVQGENRLPLADLRCAPRPLLAPWAAAEEERTIEVELGRQANSALGEGEAVLRVVAERAPAWLRRGQPAVVEHSFAVRLVPPTLEPISTQHYVAQGGSEAVVYRVGPGSVRDGVEVGARFFPGFPLPGGGGERFALFGVPFDETDPVRVRLVAEDGAGNVRTAAFLDRFFPQPPRRETIEVTPELLARVVPAILEATPELADRGDPMANYLQINRDLRRANAEELLRLATKTRPEFLWREPFLALPGGQVMSSFADRRTYRYAGREIDEQVHLGFDLASTARARVPAANRGVVVLARWLGIYGNTVVVDHGYGLMSLYAHLSSLGVAEGATVERGAALGRSGATGLAAGDHLHFTFLLHGVPVRPLEWWDAHWIRDRLQRKLGAALPFAG